MPKYLIEFPQSKATMIVEYNDIGAIIELKMNYGEMDTRTMSDLLAKLPVKSGSLVRFENSPRAKVTQIFFDTSFETFWNAYANKFGNKGRSQRLWDALNEEERTKAIKYIQNYNQWLLMNAGVSKKLPETYLNQQPWNN